mmetsp:Transcript_11763/g.33257  ORF Transcript_11763/g.33257 Transcript_11763/m.33257 type:complete len:213 (-) Transcript_11763:409-1047(-)
MVLVLDRRPVDTHDGVAYEFNDYASELVYYPRHFMKVAAQEQQRLLRGDTLNDRREVCDVGEEDCHVLLKHFDVCRLVPPDEVLDNGPRDVFAPRLDPLLHVLERAADELDLGRLNFGLRRRGDAGELKSGDALHVVGELHQRLQQPGGQEREVLRQKRDAHHDDDDHQGRCEERHPSLGLDAVPDIEDRNCRGPILKFFGAGVLVGEVWET